VATVVSPLEEPTILAATLNSARDAATSWSAAIAPRNSICTWRRT